MNEQQQKAYAAIMAILASLPWQERGDVFRAVEHNDDICVHCGMAIETRCHCTNDE